MPSGHYWLISLLISANPVFSSFVHNMTHYFLSSYFCQSSLRLLLELMKIVYILTRFEHYLLYCFTFTWFCGSSTIREKVPTKAHIIIKIVMRPTRKQTSLFSTASVKVTERMKSPHITRVWHTKKFPNTEHFYQKLSNMMKPYPKLDGNATSSCPSFPVQSSNFQPMIEAGSNITQWQYLQKPEYNLMSNPFAHILQFFTSFTRRNRSVPDQGKTWSSYRHWRRQFGPRRSQK
jgi:hypothetical protein